MVLPKAGAGLDTALIEEDGAVAVPGLGLGRAADGVDDVLAVLGLIEQSPCLGGIDAPLFGEIGQESALSLEVEALRGSQAGAEQSGPEHGGTNRHCYPREFLVLFRCGRFRTARKTTICGGCESTSGYRSRP